MISYKTSTYHRKTRKAKTYKTINKTMHRKKDLLIDLIGR